MMGGMGRVMDSGYAEYTVVPRECVIPIETDLPWETVGALPDAADVLRVADGRS
jgi:hypothetical protein